jgi:hypothetical protein
MRSQLTPFVFSLCTGLCSNLKSDTQMCLTRRTSNGTDRRLLEGVFLRYTKYAHTFPGDECARPAIQQ